MNVPLIYQLTLYPYLAIIWAATPKPFDCLSGALSAESADDGGDEGVGDEVFEDSIRESGGAIAAPPEVAVEKQSRLVEFVMTRAPNMAGNSNVVE